MTKVEIVDPWKLQRNHIWQKVKIVNTSKLMFFLWVDTLDTLDTPPTRQLDTANSLKNTGFWISNDLY